MTEQIGAALRTALAYHEAWTGKDLDRAMSYIAEDVVCDAPAGRIEGAEAYRAFMTPFVQMLLGTTVIAALAADLRGEHDVLAPGEAGDGAADELLRGAALVDVCGVPESDAELDPAPVLSEIERGRRRFDELGIEADWCLADLHGDPQSEFAAALAGNDYACVVIGGGLRSREPALELLFETVVNLVRTRQPDAAIAFDHRPDDCADAACGGSDRLGAAIRRLQRATGPPGASPGPDTAAADPHGSVRAWRA